MPEQFDAINAIGAAAPQWGGGNTVMPQSFPTSAPVARGPVSFGGGDRVNFSPDVAQRGGGGGSVPNLGWARQQPQVAAGGT